MDKLTWEELYKKVQAQSALIDELAGVLKTVQWRKGGFYNLTGDTECPCCGSFEKDGHYRYCPLSTALAKVKK